MGSVGLIFVFLTVAAAQTIVEFPDSPVGLTVEESTVLVCGISNRQSYVVTWQRIDLETGQALLIFNSLDGILDSTNYDIETPTGGGLEYFNLVVKSGARELGGIYSCIVALDSSEVSVLIFDPPGLTYGEGSLAEGMDIVFTCETTYSSPTSDSGIFSLHFEDPVGVTIPTYNNTLNSTGEPISYVQTALSENVNLNWEDDGKEYACVVTMGDYQENTTTVLTVYYAARNISLSPESEDNEYCTGDVLTVTFSSNPAGKQLIWYLWNSEAWEVLGVFDDEVIVKEEWIGNTALRVDITNSFDHDGDGIPTDQIATAVFYLFVVECVVTTPTSTQATTTTVDQERNPAISVLLTEDTAIDTSPLVFDNVITNIGDGYSDISGVFTVPTHGLHQFSVALLSVSGDAFDVRLMRNNTLLCKGYAAASEHQTGSCSAVVELLPGDEVYVNSSTDGLPVVRGVNDSGLSGFMIQKFE